jgi:MerR family transcriptional regulator, light-induced transcriptional regulator
MSKPGNDAYETPEARVRDLGREYAAAVLAGDEVAAELVIRRAMKARVSTQEIDDEIIAPALWLVGELWERGEISIADEHVATEISLRVLALQREAGRVARSRAGRRVMLAAPSGELHVIALRMVGNVLREAGYRVLMLGPDVPPDALAAFAGRHRPDVVCLSATMPGGEDRVLIAIDAIQQAWAAAGFVVGGRGLTSRVRTTPGIDVCARVSEAVESVDAMVQRASLN